MGYYLKVKSSDDGLAKRDAVCNSLLRYPITVQIRFIFSTRRTSHKYIMTCIDNCVVSFSVEGST